MSNYKHVLMSSEFEEGFQVLKPMYLSFPTSSTLMMYAWLFEPHSVRSMIGADDDPFAQLEGIHMSIAQTNAEGTRTALTTSISYTHPVVPRAVVS